MTIDIDTALKNILSACYLRLAHLTDNHNKIIIRNHERGCIHIGYIRIRSVLDAQSYNGYYFSIDLIINHPHKKSTARTLKQLSYITVPIFGKDTNFFSAQVKDLWLDGSCNSQVQTLRDASHCIIKYMKVISLIRTLFVLDKIGIIPSHHQKEMNVASNDDNHDYDYDDSDMDFDKFLHDYDKQVDSSLANNQHTDDDSPSHSMSSDTFHRAESTSNASVGSDSIDANDKAENSQAKRLQTAINLDHDKETKSSSSEPKKDSGSDDDVGHTYDLDMNKSVYQLNMHHETSDSDDTTSETNYAPSYSADSSSNLSSSSNASGVDHTADTDDHLAESSEASSGDYEAGVDLTDTIKKHMSNSFDNRPRVKSVGAKTEIHHIYKPFKRYGKNIDRVLKNIKGDDDITINNVASKLNMNKVEVSSVLRQLENHGFISGHLNDVNSSPRKAYYGNSSYQQPKYIWNKEHQKE